MKTLLLSLSLMMASANALAHEKGNKEINLKGKRAVKLFKQLNLEAQKKERNGKTFLVKKAINFSKASYSLAVFSYSTYLKDD